MFKSWTYKSLNARLLKISAFHDYRTKQVRQTIFSGPKPFCKMITTVKMVIDIFLRT
jgi:hypothetical protein